MRNPDQSSVRLLCHFASNVSTSSTNSTSHAIWKILSTVLLNSLVTSNPGFRLRELISTSNATWTFSNKIRLNFVRYFALNFSTSSTNWIWHAIWTLLTTAAFTYFLTSDQMVGLPQLTQHHMKYKHLKGQFSSRVLWCPMEGTPLVLMQRHVPHEFLEWQFSSPVRWLPIKFPHFLNQCIVTSHVNIAHYSSIQLFAHSASNFSTPWTNPTSYVIQTLATCCTFTFNYLFSMFSDIAGWCYESKIV